MTSSSRRNPNPHVETYFKHYDVIAYAMLQGAHLVRGSRIQGKTYVVDVPTMFYPPVVLTNMRDTDTFLRLAYPQC